MSVLAKNVLEIVKQCFTLTLEITKMVLLQFNLYFIFIRRFNDKQVGKSWYTIAQKVY